MAQALASPAAASNFPSRDQPSAVTENESTIGPDSHFTLSRCPGAREKPSMSPATGQTPTVDGSAKNGSSPATASSDPAGVNMAAAGRYMVGMRALRVGDGVSRTTSKTFRTSPKRTRSPQSFRLRSGTP